MIDNRPLVSPLPGVGGRILGGHHNAALDLIVLDWSSIHEI
jgi:hypothetical protein